LKSYKSKFVIGTWPLSGDFGVYSKKNILDVINLSIDNNIIEFDTSPNYGKGIVEKIIGDEIKDEITVNTKVGSFENKKKSFEINDLKSSFLRSLERLKREKVNILFIHNPRISNYKLLKIVDYFREKKESKMYNYLGISLPSQNNYLDSTLNKFDVIQDDFNLLRPYLYFKKKKPLIFYARSVLASGLLTSKNINGKNFNNPKDHRSFWLKGDRLKFLNNQVKLISNVINMPIENFSRRFALQQGYIDKVIFGVRNKQQLKNLINDIKFKQVENDLEEKIFQMYDQYSKNNKLKY